MPRQRVSGRALPLLRNDTKRNLRDKSAQFLRVYIGRKAVAMMVAEKLLEEMDGFPAISPSAQSILRIIEKLALEEEE